MVLLLLFIKATFFPCFEDVKKQGKISHYGKNDLDSRLSFILWLHKSECCCPVLSEHIKKQVQMFQMRGKGEMSCLKLYISIQHLLLFFFLKRKDIFFLQTLFYLWVMFLMFLFLWHLCLSGEPVEEWGIGEHAVLILGVSQLGQKS